MNSTSITWAAVCLSVILSVTAMFRPAPPTVIVDDNFEYIVVLFECNATANDFDEMRQCLNDEVTEIVVGRQTQKESN